MMRNRAGPSAAEISSLRVNAPSKSGNSRRRPVLLTKATAMSISLAALIAAHRYGRK
ncbi:hypothetical protein D3C77_682960 [compost metagenome]